MLYFCTFKGVKEWLLKSAGAPRTNGKSQKDLPLWAMAKGRPSGLQGLATMNEASKVIFRMAYTKLQFME
jgi:hypothetical protein